MNINMENVEKYRISDMYLLAYVIYKGIKYLETEMEDNEKHKIHFIFENNDKLKKVVQDFFSQNTTEIVMGDYITSILRTKLLINQIKHG